MSHHHTYVTSSCIRHIIIHMCHTNIKSGFHSTCAHTCMYKTRIDYLLSSTTLPYRHIIIHMSHHRIHALQSAVINHLPYRHIIMHMSHHRIHALLPAIINHLPYRHIIIHMSHHRIHALLPAIINHLPYRHQRVAQHVHCRCKSHHHTYCVTSSCRCQYARALQIVTRMPRHHTYATSSYVCAIPV